MRLVDLAPELLLNIAAFLPQVDLLNIAITSKHLRDVTQPELYREYNNDPGSGRSLMLLVMRLVRQPELSKHVRRVNIGVCQHVGNLCPSEMKREDVKLIEDQAGSVSEG